MYVLLTYLRASMFLSRGVLIGLIVGMTFILLCRNTTIWR